MSSPLLRSVDVEGVLKQDYVLVEDTRAVEFNRVADGTLGRALQLILLRLTLSPQKSKPPRAGNHRYPRRRRTIR